MSVTGVSPSDSSDKIINKNSFQWIRNDSGELDVFEAARYFSGANESPNGYITSFEQSLVRKNATRMSLDMSKRNQIPPKNQDIMEKEVLKENKKFYKQPNSPGARLASFLNSLFSQKSLKKKKPKPGSFINTNTTTTTTTASIDLEEEEMEIPSGHGLRRKRRSSITHFPITTLTANSGNDSKSIYSSSSSGFTTPHPYANTPTKSYKEFIRSFSDHPQQQPVVSHVPKITREKNDLKPCSFLKCDEESGMDYGWMDEKFSYRKWISEKMSKNIGSDFEFSDHRKFGARDWVEVHEYDQRVEREYRKFSDGDQDGADSDSSSDLFDLPNHGMDFCSTGLPVYETTQMERIKTTHSLISTTAAV